MTNYDEVEYTISDPAPMKMFRQICFITKLIYDKWIRKCYIKLTCMQYIKYCMSHIKCAHNMNKIKHAINLPKL